MVRGLQRIFAVAATAALLISAGGICLNDDAAAAEKMFGRRLHGHSVSGQIGRIETFTLNDTERKKELLCRITYPKTAAAPCPVVIFSHGALGSKDSYGYLVDFLAGHGYVCIQPTHADSMSLAPKVGRLFKARETLDALPSNAEAWGNRALDISLIIESLPLIGKEVPVPLSENQIACAGHSFGAFTTALVAGAAPPSPAVRTCYLDKRVSAAVLMSPQGIRHSRREFGFEDKHAWENIGIPCLFLTGTMDNTRWTQFSDRQVAFNDCPPGDKYLAVIKGAGHMTFAGTGNGYMIGDIEEENGPSGSVRQEILRKLSESMTPEEGDRKIMDEDICKLTDCFLDAYLRKNAQAKNALASVQEFGPLVELRNR